VIATAVTLPVVILLALLIGNITGDANAPKKSGPPGAIVVPAPPHAAANAATCNKVIGALPVQLGTLAPRVVHPHPDSPYVVAWGDPAVILSCGVDRPAALQPGSSQQLFDAGDLKGPYYVVTTSGSTFTWTSVDRAVYLSIQVPAKYHATPVVALSKAIASVLPAVCSTNPKDDPHTLCAERTD